MFFFVGRKIKKRSQIFFFWGGGGVGHISFFCVFHPLLRRVGERSVEGLHVQPLHTLIHPKSKFHPWNSSNSDTVDGRNPAPVDMVNIHKYPIIYRVLYIPGGAGFLPSTVS